MKLSNKVIKTQVKPVVHVLLALPVLLLLYDWWLALGGQDHGMTANPIEFTNRYLGDWAMRWIVLGLAISPAASLLKFQKLIKFRRMVGLWAFSYVCLHVTSYVALDHYFDWATIGGDIIKRTYITIGMACLIMLVPLALTSTANQMKKLGAKRWQKLHSLIYIVGPLVTLHYMMMAKGNQLEPKLWMAGVFVLLGLRLIPLLKKRLRSQEKTGP